MSQSPPPRGRDDDRDDRRDRDRDRDYDRRDSRERDRGSDRRDDRDRRRRDDSRDRYDDRGRDDRRRDDRRDEPPPRPGAGGGNFQKGIACQWNERGFGFIKPESGGEDIFCHASAIIDGNALKDGTEVEFRVVFDERRGKYRADEVTGGTSEESRGHGDRMGGGGGDRDRYGGYSGGGGGDRYGDRDRGGDRYGDRGRDRY